MSSSPGPQKGAPKEEKGSGVGNQQELDKRRGSSPAALGGDREKQAQEGYAPEYENAGKDAEACGAQVAAGSGSPASEGLDLREQSSSGGAPGGEEERRSVPAHPKAASQEHRPVASSKSEGPQAKKPFDPATDLNIFEQINFDEMNINLEDINQSNQKQDVINSSNSDIGDQGGDTSVEYGAGSNGASAGGPSGGPNVHGMMIPGGLPHQAKPEALGAIGDVEAAHQLLANDILDTSNELLREVEVLDQEGVELYGDEGQSEVDIDVQQSLQPYDGMQSSPMKEKQDKYNKIGSIGTELQIIESMSNEVSSNSRQNSQQTNPNENATPGEILGMETGGSRGSYTGSESVNNVSRDYQKNAFSIQKPPADHLPGVHRALKQPFSQGDIQESGYDESHPISIQDGLHRQQERKNAKAFQHM